MREGDDTSTRRIAEGRLYTSFGTVLTKRPNFPSVDFIMVALKSLVFDNLALRALPVDGESGSQIRQVAKACYSRVSPTPLNNPKLVAVSQPALQVLDLDPSEVLHFS